MFNFIFKAVTDNSLYRNSDEYEFGAVKPAESSPDNHVYESFIISSPDLTSKIVDVGIHFENADTLADYMRAIKLMGSEYENQYGLYVEQSYTINGSVTNDLSGYSPSLIITNERPVSVTRASNIYTFNLNYTTDVLAAPVVVVDSINNVTWTESGPGTGIFNAPAAPGVLLGSGINHGTGVVTLVYSGTYNILNPSVIFSNYTTTYIMQITDVGREELEDVYLVTQTNSKTTTAATITFLDENKVAKTNSRNITGYDSNYKTLTFASGLATLGPINPYEPKIGDRYKIVGTSTRYITYDQGHNENVKLLFASRSARIQSPNDKIEIKIGLKLPKNLFVAAQPELDDKCNIKPVITYSVEE